MEFKRKTKEVIDNVLNPGKDSESKTEETTDDNGLKKTIRTSKNTVTPEVLVVCEKQNDVQKHLLFWDSAKNIVKTVSGAVTRISLIVAITPFLPDIIAALLGILF